MAKRSIAVSQKKRTKPSTMIDKNIDNRRFVGNILGKSLKGGKESAAGPFPLIDYGNCNPLNLLNRIHTNLCSIRMILT